ncbi:MAG: hypothetical protein LQ341_000208 [Variospora aurantia]|nr:MAG: hypothetical protein LQ341_000208 [Variospora aurantia]
MPIGRSEKTMSSRLLTMKFMQRAAAGSSASRIPNPDDHPSKRRKLSANQTSPITPSAGAQAFQVAADAEDVKRAAGSERLATEAGETRWVLSTLDAEHTIGTDLKLRFLTAGYSDIDQDAQSTGWEDSLGRRSFGRFHRAMEVLLSYQLTVNARTALLIFTETVVYLEATEWYKLQRLTVPL